MSEREQNIRFIMLEEEIRLLKQNNSQLSLANVHPAPLPVGISSAPRVQLLVEEVQLLQQDKTNLWESLNQTRLELDEMTKNYEACLCALQDEIKMHKETEGKLEFEMARNKQREREGRLEYDMEAGQNQQQYQQQQQNQYKQLSTKREIATPTKKINAGNLARKLLGLVDGDGSNEIVVSTSASMHDTSNHSYHNHSGDRLDRSNNSFVADVNYSNNRSNVVDNAKVNGMLDVSTHDDSVSRRINELMVEAKNLSLATIDRNAQNSNAQVGRYIGTRSNVSDNTRYNMIDREGDELHEARIHSKYIAAVNEIDRPIHSKYITAINNNNNNNNSNRLLPTKSKSTLKSVNKSAIKTNTSSSAFLHAILEQALNDADNDKRKLALLDQQQQQPQQQNDIGKRNSNKKIKKMNRTVAVYSQSPQHKTIARKSTKTSKRTRPNKPFR